MDIRQFTWNIVDSNSFLLIEKNNGLLIDAVDNEELYQTLLHLNSLTIILTHSHFDHIIGLNKIRSMRPDAVVICTKLCSEHIGNVYRNLSSSATAFMTFYEHGNKKDVVIEPFTCQTATQTFDEKMIFDWFGHNIQLKAVYGHSNDGLVAIIDSDFLFSGDTLLAIPTVTRFPNGSSKRFWEEDIPMLKTLNIKQVFPGHGGIGDLQDFDKDKNEQTCNVLHGSREITTL